MVSTVSSYTSTTRINPGQAAASKERTLLWTCFVLLVLIGPLLTAAYLLGRMSGPAAGRVSQDAGALEKGAPGKSEQERGKRVSAPASATPQSDLRGTYLQLGAGEHPEVLLERLVDSGFPATSVEIPERPGLYRVLVGPLADDHVADTRARLESAGLNGNRAIPKVF